MKILLCIVWVIVIVDMACNVDDVEIKHSEDELIGDGERFLDD